MNTFVPRSFLYVPANRPDLFAKAYDGPADAVVLDLEDAVPLAEKTTARAALTSWFESLDRTDGRPQQWVRVAPETVGVDLEAVVAEPLDGIFLAKCTLAALVEMSDRFAQLESGRPAVPVVGLIESGRGLAELSQMAAHARLTTFGMGETDLLSDLRMARAESTAGAIDALRLQIVVACAAAGLPAPVAPTSTAFRDLDAFERTSAHLRDIGFRSRTAIHPGQVPIIHEVFTPTSEEIVQAQDVLGRFEAARGGITTDVDGHLIDAAVVRAARETMSRREVMDHRSA